jgi:molybdate transport system ATP-binding protein
MSLSVNIKKSFGSFHLDVNFEAENGVLGLLGASGCGKSMTLRCIAGIITPDEGKIVLDSRTLFDSERKINLSPQKRRVGLLFQNYALFPNMTVEQNIRCGLRDKTGKAEGRRLVSEMIKKMRLEGLENHHPYQLSGGQQQRTALARILVGKPAILMLDEPFSALDSYLRWEVEMELSDILREYGGTTLLVSHSRDEVYRLCDDVCVIDSGKSEPVVPVKMLFEKPTTLDSALLSGCKNFSRARKTGDTTVFAEDWGATLQCARTVPDDVAYIGVRSHYIIPQHSENAITCKVTRVVEDVFGMVIMLKPDGAKEDSQYGKIRMDISKEYWERLGGIERMVIGMAAEDILLLK